MAGRADIAAGRAFVTLYVKTSEFAHGLVSAEARLKAFGNAVESFGEMLAAFSPASLLHKLTNALTAMGDAIASAFKKAGAAMQSLGMKTAIAGAGIAAALGYAASYFGHAGDSLWVLHQRTGVSTQALSELGYAARQTGTDIGDVEVGIRGMQRTIGDAATGGNEAAESLARLGTSASALAGLSPEDQLAVIADGLAQIDDPTLQASAALDVLGRSGASLLPILRNGSAGLNEFRNEAKLLGLSITPTQARLAEQLVDKFQALKEAGLAAVFAAGEALAADLLKVIKIATDLSVRFHAWVVANQETVRLVGKIAIGLLTAGAGAMVIGKSLSAMGSIVGVFTKAFSMLGHAVASLLPIVTVLHLVVSAFGIGPIMAFIGSVASAVSSAGWLSTALSGIGVVFTAVLPEVLAVAGAILAGLAGLAAAAAATGAAVVGLVVAFWKLTDPIGSLGPLFTGAMESAKQFTSALLSGNWQGAADALISGLNTALRRGVAGLMSMAMNAMRRLPGLIRGVLSGTSDTFGFLGRNLSQAFAELWPTFKLSLVGMLSLARDVWNQFPEIAGYAIGRVVRAMVSGWMRLQEWMGQAIVKLGTVLLETFAKLGPALIKAMISGDIGAIANELSGAFRAAALGAGLYAGLADAKPPDFKPSATTVAAWEQLSKTVASATGAAPGHEPGATTKPRGGMVLPEIKKPDIDPSTLQKYRQRLEELFTAFAAGKLNPIEFANGLAQARREILGIEPAPIDRFRDRVELLTEALERQQISADEWLQQVAEAKQSILGIDPSPLQQFRDRVDVLRDALAAGATSLDVYRQQVRQAGQDLFELDPSPLQKLENRIRQLNDALQAGAITKQEWREEFSRARREILGLDESPLTSFAERIAELRKQLAAGAITTGEFAAGFRAAKQEFLGLDTDPIETFRRRYVELQDAVRQGLISPQDAQKALLEAMPDKLKATLEKIKTPLDRYREEMASLNEIKPLLNPAQFDAAKKLLDDELANSQKKGDKAGTFSTYNAATLAYMGPSGGGPQDRLLKEAREQRRIAQEQLEEMRRATRAAERLASGLSFGR